MTRLLISFVCLAVAVVTSLPLEEPHLLTPGHSRVVNGENATTGQFPFQISFQRSDFNGHFCGGSIIDAEYVVIAAHCVDDLTSLISAKVVAGSLIWNGADETAQTVEVEQSTYYSGWRPTTINYDYAVLKLKSPGIDLSQENVATIPLAPVEIGDPLGLECTASGWGADENGRPPVQLKWTQAYGITDEQCRGVNSNTVAECTSCTLDPDANSGICFGDSGGPLVCTVEGTRWLFGIASWGYGSGVSCSTSRPNGWGQVTFQAAQDFINEACNQCLSA